MHYINLLMMCLVIFSNFLMLHIGDLSKFQDSTLNGNKTNRIVKHCDHDVVWRLVGVGTLNLVNPIQNPYSFGNFFKI